MSRPYRVVVPRKDEKSGKTYWTEIGAAWKRDNGSISVKLSALPIGSEMVIFPPDEGGGRRGQSSEDKADDVPY